MINSTGESVRLDAADRRWIPGVDYLIGESSHTTAYCMYCFYETEWIGYLRAEKQVTGHLNTRHGDRREITNRPSPR